MNNEDILDDLDDLDDEIMNEEEEQVEDVQPDTEIRPSLHSKLLNHQPLLDHLKLINNLINTKLERGQKHLSEDTKQNIELTNKYVSQLQKEIAAITKYVKEQYAAKMPELQSMVPINWMYCQAILDIEENMKIVDETSQKQPFDYLNPHQRISVRMAVSSPHDPLPSEVRANVLTAVQVVATLQNHLEDFLAYLQSSIQFLAPNLSQLVGTQIASKLISTAGGLDRLSMMPACNVKVMGGTKAAQVGLSGLERSHTGVFGKMQVVKSAPKKFQMQLVRMLASNAVKCARADYLGSTKELGLKLHRQMYQRFEKVQEEGGLMSQEKPDEIPDLQPKKKRGGKRHRKKKELFQQSEMRKLQNRIQFNEAEEQIDEGVGLGMLKGQNLGKMRVGIKKQKINNSKKMKQRMEKKSGFESTLNLAAQEGIQLINPALQNQKQQQQQRGTESYFNRSSGFRTVINQKLMQK